MGLRFLFTRGCEKNQGGFREMSRRRETEIMPWAFLLASRG